MPATYLAAIPAYYMVCFGAHAYSQNLLLGSSNPRAYDNSNPRSAGNTAVFSKALGPKGYARWERAKAAHQNGLESFPLFAITVLALHQLGWPEAGLTGAAAVAWGNVAARIVYTYIFINTESRRQSYWRSAVWTAATLGNCAALAAAALMSK